MKKKFFCFLVGFIVALSAICQQQRALIIGIDHYAPPSNYTPDTSVGRLDFPNLEGCKNDAISINEIITHKFGFNQKDIDTLFDDAATRENILNEMRLLLEKSNAGDIAFIYYAGHGSEVLNSLSTKGVNKDQTIVPSNTWKKGVPDIRDKELSKIFNDFIDKKIKLTVIFDCCHSGSISRGPNNRPGKLRFMPASNWDAKDPGKFETPENRIGGYFLIFSAAQADEFAAEDRDDHDIPHGAFTLALIDALNEQSVNTSAASIFNSARAILKNNGKDQEPIIGGIMERQQETLFGMQKGKLTDYTYVAIAGRGDNNRLKLQAGFALGLLKGNELSMINDQKDTVFKLRVDTVLGMTKSLALVIKGNIQDIKPGYLFRITNWVSSGRPLIKLYIPKSELSDADVSKFTNVAKELKNSSKIKWVNTINKGERDPYATVFWINNKCFIKIDTDSAKEIKNITTQNILQYCKKDSTLYVELPVSKQNSIEYSNKLNENKNLKLVEDLNNSNYTLYGRLGDNGLPAYGFRKSQIAARDSLESMPILTDCFELSPKKNDHPKNIADSLNDIALKLSKLRGWLTLNGPDATKNGFGYDFVIYNQSKKHVITTGIYQIGDTITLKLIQNNNYYSEITNKPRWIYVFTIDQSGAMTLDFPESDGNDINKYPKPSEIKEIPLITVIASVPSGTDNYFLLAADEPITNAMMILNQAGVYQGVQSRGISNSNPLTDLLDLGNVGSRSKKIIPSSWSLEKFSFKCTY